MTVKWLCVFGDFAKIITLSVDLKNLFIEINILKVPFENNMTIK